MTFADPATHARIAALEREAQADRPRPARTVFDLVTARRPDDEIPPQPDHRPDRGEEYVMNDFLDLAALSLALGREPRATLHPDGVTSETVATHSHMLVMVACTVAARHPERFDVGLVAQFATVHDVPEVAPGGPGDLDTFNTTDAEAVAKRDAAEDEAIARLVELHPGWLGDLCVRYRDQREPEARLVRYLDKVLPKLTLALSGAAQFRRDGHTADYFERFVAQQGAKLRDEYPDLAELCGAIYDAGNDLVREAMQGCPKGEE